MVGEWFPIGGYVQKTTRRKRCLTCHRLIEDGAETDMRKIKSERYSPVKGVLKVTKYQFVHSACGTGDAE